jgi:hypothetical protein
MSLNGSHSMISNRFNTIFVHIPKTAGQSVETIFLEQHKLRWDERAPLLLKYNPDPSRGPERLAHLLAREYLEYDYVSNYEFARFFTFAIVRNPYDRTISDYRYFHRVPRVSFKEFIESLPYGNYFDLARHAEKQVEFVRNREGKIILDRIVKFERLFEELEPILKTIFGIDVRLPHINKSQGPNMPSSTLSDECKRLIYRRYEEDFDVFKYQSGFLL